MKNKFIFLIGLVSIVSLIFIVVTVKQHTKTNPTISPVPSATGPINLPTSNPRSPTPEIPHDAKYGQAITNLIRQYPWYPKLPIENNDYSIIYDFEKQSFRIRLKIPLTDDQGKSMIKRAITDLETIGVAAPIKYYVLDINGVPLKNSEP